MNRYETLLLETAARDERLVVITAENRGHMRTVPPLLGDRFIDVGIAEQTMIGMAAGMAVRGRVVVTHALAAFLTLRAFEFIRDDVAIANVPVIMVGMVPGVMSDGNGPTHQAIEDVAIMRGLPNMGVFCPCDESEFIDGMRVLLESRRPWYVRYINTPDLAIDRVAFEPGVANVVRGEMIHRPDVTILTYGFLTRQCIEAAEELGRDDIQVRVVNMRTLKPADEQAILHAAATSGLVVTVEDHFLTGGLASIVAETLMAHGKGANVLTIGFPTWFTPGRLGEVLAHERINSAAIAQRIRQRLADIVHAPAQPPSLPNEVSNV
jgi:transketolase